MPRSANRESKLAATGGLKNLDVGNCWARIWLIVVGVRRNGGGRRVRTDMASKAAWPASPSRRSPTASATAEWCPWSTDTKAMATLLSTKASGPSALVGIPQRPDHLVGERSAGERDDQPSVLLG